MSDAHLYRIKQLGVERVFGPSRFTVPGKLTPGAALDTLAAKRREYRVPPAIRVELQWHDPRRGWVRAAAESD